MSLGAIKQISILFLIALVSLTIFSHGYNLEKRFTFSWDQERDANIIWQIVKSGKFTLIGPRVISDDAFFLGPLWYYLLLPFYFLFSMDPIAAAFFVMFISVINALTVYFVTKGIFGRGVAMACSLILASSGDLVAWNPIVIPLVTVILIYLLQKITNGNQRLIPYAFLTFGLGLQLHFQAIFFIIPIVLALFFYTKSKHFLPKKNLLIGFILFGLTLLPLIIFDIRHEFLNVKGVIKLFFSPSPTGYSMPFLDNFSQVAGKYFSSLIFFLPRIFSTKFIMGFLVFLLSIIGIIFARISFKIKALLLSFILAPLLFSLYKGSISEYYFALTFIPVLMGFINSFKLLKVFNIGQFLLAIFVVWLLVTRISDISQTIDSQSLYYKKQAVKFIVDEKQDKIFNVSFSVPTNADAGFRYLFKFYGREPQNIPEGHLWTIVIPARSENVAPLTTFGDIGVVRR